jgi:hypothetical protein
MPLPEESFSKLMAAVILRLVGSWTTIKLTNTLGKMQLQMHMASTLVTLITHTASPSHNKSPNSRSFWHFVKHLTPFPDFLQLLSSDFVARSNERFLAAIQ